MTVSTQVNKSEYVGNGVTTVFAYDFLVLEASDMVVYLGGAVASPSLYTLDGVGNPAGGNVTFGSPPAVDVTVVLYREVPYKQLVDYVEYDPFPAETHERALDRLTMQCQQLAEGLTRTRQDPIGGTPIQEEFPLGTVLFFQQSVVPNNWTLKDIGDVVLGVSNGSDKLYSGQGPGEPSAGSWTITLQADGQHYHTAGGLVGVASAQTGPLRDEGDGANTVTPASHTHNVSISGDTSFSVPSTHVHTVNTFRAAAATGLLAEKTSPLT